MQGRLPQRPRWSVLRRLPYSIAAAALLLLAAATKPSQGHFEQFAHHAIHTSMGYWPGACYSGQQNMALMSQAIGSESRQLS